MNLLDIFTQPFLARSLIVGLILSVSCGIIGSFIVVKKISSISGGLAHAAFGGIGLGFILNIKPMIGAVIFCILCAFILGVSYRRKISGFETLISILWSTGMGLGMVFIALTPRYTPDPASYLFGNIVLVPEAYIYFALALNILILCSMKVVFKELHAISFDEEFAEISGLNVDLFFHYLLLLISLTIVVLLQLTGAILTISLLTTPAVIASQWCSSLKKMFYLSTAITAIGTTIGIYLSYILSTVYDVNIPTGPMIILVLCLGYLISSVKKYRAAF